MQRLAFCVVALLIGTAVAINVMKLQDPSGDVSSDKDAQQYPVTILAWYGSSDCSPLRHVYVGGYVYVYCAFEGIVLRDDVKVRGNKRKLRFSRVERSQSMPSGRRCPANYSCFRVKLTGKRPSSFAGYTIDAAKELGLKQSWTYRMGIEVVSDCFSPCQSNKRPVL